VVHDWAEQANQLCERGEYEKAADIASQALEHAQRYGHQQQEATAYNTIGISFLKRSMYELAITNFLQAEKLLSVLNNDNELLPCLVNIAIVLNAQKMYEKAKEYYQKALYIVGDKNTMQKAQVLNGLGNLLHNTHQHHEALLCFRQVKSIAQELGAEFGVAMGARNAAACLIELGQYESAYIIAAEALGIAAQNSFPELHIGSIQAMAEAALNLGDIEKAINLLSDSQSAVLGLGDDYNLRYHYQLLYKAHKENGDFTLALNYHELWSGVHERMSNAERTKTINQLHIQFESEKKEVALQKAILLQKELELAALKSRMNPHFLFNALSTIQRQLYRNAIEEAISAIDNFSLLTREVLRQSSLDWISVKQEVKTLEAYISLEKLQLQGRFSFQIIGADDCSFFEIPPLMLQPVVENALHHGLRHKEGDKVLDITFHLKADEVLQVTIEDNGIGRQKSANLNRNRFGHRSFALQSVIDRIKLLREKGIMIVDYEVIDKFEGTKPTGTQTVFTFRYTDL